MVDGRDALPCLPVAGPWACGPLSRSSRRALIAALSSLTPFGARRHGPGVARGDFLAHAQRYKATRLPTPWTKPGVCRKCVRRRTRSSDPWRDVIPRVASRRVARGVAERNRHCRFATPSGARRMAACATADDGASPRQRSSNRDDRTGGVSDGGWWRRRAAWPGGQKLIPGCAGLLLRLLGRSALPASTNLAHGRAAPRRGPDGIGRGAHAASV